MKGLYRFSPIKNKDELLDAIEYIHLECFKLCKNSLGKFFPVSGNIGVFCHYGEEYKLLTDIQKELTEIPDDPKQKYLPLRQPIIIPAKDGIPETTYTHLYVRKPDPYRHHVGDMDFLMTPEEYKKLKERVVEGKVKGARNPNHPSHDMVEFFDPDSDVLGYIGNHHLL